LKRQRYLRGVSLTLQISKDNGGSFSTVGTIAGLTETDQEYAIDTGDILAQEDTSFGANQLGLSLTDTAYTRVFTPSGWPLPASASNANFVFRIIANTSGNTVRVDSIQIEVQGQTTGGGAGGGVEI
jgi:hypothetical protein